MGKVTSRRGRGTARIESILEITGLGLSWTKNPFHRAHKEGWEKYAHLMPLYHKAHTIRDPTYDPVVIGSAQDQWEKYYLLDVKTSEKGKLDVPKSILVRGFGHHNYVPDRNRAGSRTYASRILYISAGSTLLSNSEIHKPIA